MSDLYRGKTAILDPAASPTHPLVSMLSDRKNFTDSISRHQTKQEQIRDEHRCVLACVRPLKMHRDPP